MGSKSCFAPVADAATRVLILGSLPGEASLKQIEYYAHPRNQFWRLVGTIVGIELDGSPYPVRLATLLSAGVGLWDVIQSAERVGSLDANIRDHKPAPLGEFIKTLPSLRAIGLNGGKASEIGRKQLGPQCALVLITLPSSSPAYTLSLERKQAEWSRLKAFLNKGAYTNGR